MPAIQVARTDTFEQQRVKINDIGSQLFSITQGGSDLATGNLKIGDGTRTAPSLAFASDASLGIYKSDEGTFGFVSGGRKLVAYTNDAVYSYKDFIVQQNVLSSSGISLLSKGSNYDAGNYLDVPLFGGTGSGATADITVIEFGGTITSNGINYNEGSYSNIPLSGGNGSGAIISFDVSGIEGYISNFGSGYVPGNYLNVNLSGGNGSGAVADIVVTGSTIITGNITSPGSGYTPGVYNSVSILNKPTQVFSVTTIPNPGSPPPDNVYVIDGNTQATLTLVKGNTYRFDISDASVSGHPFTLRPLVGEALNFTHYRITKYGTEGTAGSFVEFVIKPTAPTETIQYICQSHTGMGANISVTDGTSLYYGTFGIADVTINSSGLVSDFVFTSTGLNYKENDILEIYNGNINGTGSGFEYTLSAPVYTGTVTNVTIQDNGQDYLQDDVLSADVSDIGGFGSGFSFTISNNPLTIQSVTFNSRGSGYLVGDLLELPGTIGNISTFLKGEVNNIATTLSNSSPIITVSDTTGIIPGMSVFQPNPGDIGLLAEGTTVLTVDSSTQITLSATPTTSGSANLRFFSTGGFTTIPLTSVDGILVNSRVEKISGTGVLSPNTFVSSINVLTNEITISAAPVSSGDVVLSFVPEFGDPLSSFEYEIQNLGEIDSYTITNGGNGYSQLDQLTVNPSNLTQKITYNVINRSLITLSFVETVPIGTFSVGDFIKRRDGQITSFSPVIFPQVSPTVISNITTNLSDSSATITVSNTSGISTGSYVTQNIQTDIGRLLEGTTVLSVDSSTELTLSSIPTVSGSATLTFTSNESGIYSDVQSTTDGNGTGATFNIERNAFGDITNVQINSVGYYYASGDAVTIDGSLVGGSSGIHDIVLTISLVSSSIDLEIFDIKDDGINITDLLVTFDSISPGTIIIVPGTSTPTYTVDSVSGIKYRYFIDTGNGPDLNPDITLYSGNVYEFDLSDSSNSSHIFSLSKYPGGIWGQSLIENISATLLTTSSQITVLDSTGIVPGMIVTVSSGSGILSGATTVVSVLGNVIELSSAPLNSGAVVLTFTGVEYIDGIVRSESTLSIQISDDTPNLYYYDNNTDPVHADEGGEPGYEAVLTIDLNNPKVFGSGFTLSVVELNTEDIISADIETGDLTAVRFIGDEVQVSSVEASSSIITSSLASNTISTLEIQSSENLLINAQLTNLSGRLNIGSTIQIFNTTGNITTSGVLKTTNSLNINDGITITNNNIASTTGNNLLLTPATGRVAKVNTNTALTIPSGTTAQRPTSGIVENGSIRFNTETGQYEGYSAATASWSSLGGVRDLDGNTYIAAEASIGANDNTLYFFNDGNNTVSVTPNYLQFVNVKKIRSVNTTVPSFTEYTTNTQVTLGQYLKYRNNIYEVTISGQTGTSGNEPTHTSGAATNGTAELTWYASAVAPLSFEEVEEVRIDPLGFADLVVNNELRFSNSTISTDLNDLIVRPNSGKKVTIDAESSLVIPVGDSNQRGVAAQGSIRYNTDISQYEGYDGSNWTSLGGVKDVDGNTYIIPETAPGSNENILYFYNDGINTMRLSTNSLEFTNIDAITSQNNNLDIEASTVTFNNLAATIDTSGSSTFISTTKDNLDLGLAVGLNVDPLLRLDINGDIYLNKAFGTGSFDGIKLFNSDLSTLELSDLAISTDDIALIKGGTNSGASVLYDPTRDSGAKVTVSIVNQTTGDKEMIEYQVIDKGSDIYHTDIGNLNTGVNLVSSVFDFDANNNVRVTFTLTDLTVGDVVNITVVKHIFKK